MFPQIQGKQESPHLRSKPVFKPPAHSMEHSSFQDRKHGALGFTGVRGSSWACPCVREVERLSDRSDSGSLLLCVFILQFHHVINVCADTAGKWNMMRPQCTIRGCKYGGTLACVCFIRFESTPLKGAVMADYSSLHVPRSVVWSENGHLFSLNTQQFNLLWNKCDCLSV